MGLVYDFVWAGGLSWIKRGVANVSKSLAFAGPARAEESAQELLNKYDHGHQATRREVEFYLSGMANGIGSANGEPNVTNPFFCDPSKLSLDMANLDVSNLHVTAHPEVANYPAGLAFLHALKEMFPCKVSGNAN
jgi:hypothetical protein